MEENTYMKNFYVKTAILLVLLLAGITVIQAQETLSKAESNLNAGIQSNDMPKVREAVRLLTGINSDKSIKVLIDYLNRISVDNYDPYWAILKGFTSFTNEEALELLANFIVSSKNKPAGRDALFIMRNNQSTGMIKLLTRILEKGGRGQQMLALDYLSDIKSKLSISAMVDFLKNPDCLKEDDLKERTIKGINVLIGKPVGQTPDEITQWWAQHQNDNEKSLFTLSATVTNAGNAAEEYAEIDIIKRLPKDKIIVVLSDCQPCESIGKKAADWDHNFDHIENVLELMQVPHTVIKKVDFDKESFKLNDKIMVIFNCNYIRKHCVCPTCGHSDTRAGLRSGSCAVGCNKHILYTNMVSDKTIEKIRDFVTGGGYLFSEDWVLEEVLERAFKGIISKSKYYVKGKDVTILPGPGATIHPYLKGVFEKAVTTSSEQASSNSVEPSAAGGETISVKRQKVGEGKWKIDKDSPDIKIDKPQEVTVLMVSQDLKVTEKDSGAIAVTFNYGTKGLIPSITGGESNTYYTAKNKTGGQVLHVLSHFGKQHEPTDEFVLQNLMLNFLKEAAERYFHGSKK